MTELTQAILLDSTGQELVNTLEDIKGVLNTKMFTPSVIIDEKTITENGTYIAEDENADGYAKVTVNVASGGNYDELEVTENGVYYASEYPDIDAWDSVSVNVPSGGTAIDFSSVMGGKIPSIIEVPEVWEIPVNVTSINRCVSIPLTNQRNLTSIVLADDHPGITNIDFCSKPFDGFDNLTNIGFEIPLIDGKVESYVFSHTSILNIEFAEPATFLGDECFAYLSQDHVGVFSCNKITNEDYMVNEDFSDSGLYEYDGNWGESKIYINDVPDHTYRPGDPSLFPYRFKDEKPVYTSVRYTHDFDGHSWNKGKAWDTKPELLNADGTPYTEEQYYFFYKEDNDDHNYYWVLSHKDGSWEDIDEREEQGVAFSQQKQLYKTPNKLYTGNTWKLEHLQDSEGWWYVLTYKDRTSPIEYKGAVGVLNDYAADQFKENYNNITGYNLPNLVKVGRYMFLRNHGVEEFSFPKVTRIQEGGFQECVNATTFNLPKCEFFYGNSFNQCEKMQLLNLSQVTSVTKIENSGDFPQLDNPVTVQVPSTLLSDFQANNDWSQLVNDNKVVLQGV